MNVVLTRRCRTGPRLHLRTVLHVCVGASALLAALLSGAGCQSGPVPAQEFVAQAEQLHSQAILSTVPRDRDLADYFNAVGQRVIQGASDASDGQFKDPVFATMQFHLVGSDIPNAFTTGGRHIYIYNGLFQICQSEEELAAVMAHEFAHAVDLDVQRSGMTPSPGNSLDQIAYAFAQFPVSPGAESEADARAFQFYARGGWDPTKYGAVYSRLSDPPWAQPPAPGAGRGVTNVPGIPAAARSVAAQAMPRNLPPQARNWRKANVADAGTFRELQAKAKASPVTENSMPQNRTWLYLKAFPNCILPADLPAQKAAQEQLRRDTTPVAPTIAPEAS